MAALKLFCSGGRDDAERLFELQRDRLSLDEINPWFFKVPLTPLVAARKSRRKIQLNEVMAHVRSIQRKFPLVLIEGAGGLLSPLGEQFDSNDLIRTLRAIPIVVCPNRLGAINQARLVFQALPSAAEKRAQLILVDPPRRDSSYASNIALLREFLGDRIHRLPRTDVRQQMRKEIVRTLNQISRQVLPT